MNLKENARSCKIYTTEKLIFFSRSLKTCHNYQFQMGKKGGLVTLLQKDFPELLACHCLAHRLELSFRDVVKADKKYERLSTLLLGIFYFYKRSPKQRKNLRHTFEVFFFLRFSIEFFKFRSTKLR